MSVLVVGAGLGGLSAALHLAAAGREVIVVEKNIAVGGKMGWFEQNGFRFDTGPTLLTMPFVLRQLFAEMGENLEDHLQLVPLEPACRYFFSDGSKLDVSHSLNRTLEAVAKFSPGDAEAARRFVERGKQIYEVASPPFLFDSFGEWSWRYFLKHWKSFLKLHQLDAFRSYHEAVKASFRDPRMIQLFDRFATYNGSSPFRTPATFAIIPYVELALGGWYVRGGLYSIAESLAKIAARKGVSIRTGTACREILIRDGRAAGVKLVDGSVLEGEAVVVNADALYAYERLIPAEALPKEAPAKLSNGELSTSGFVLLLGIDKTYPHLAHHNLFFSPDYAKEFEDIFERQLPPEEPTVYVSVSSKSDPAMAPAAGSNLFVMVNVPAIQHHFDWRRTAADYRRRVLDRLKGCGFEDIESHIRVERMITPSDLENRFHAFHGAIYGFASHSAGASFRRLRNRSRDIRGLYFAGGSAHPGGGIPLVLLSGKIAADLVLAHERETPAAC